MRSFQLIRRGDLEHVILANCRDSSGAGSSQMAYFQGAVNSSPDTVAFVKTSPGLTQVWESTGDIAATFPDGNVFTVSIPHPVPAGQYAGAGHNLQRDFTCWFNVVKNVYNWDVNSCDQIYDCNHSAAPLPSSSTAAATASNTPTPTIAPAAPATPATPTNQPTTKTEIPVVTSTQPPTPAPSSQKPASSIQHTQIIPSVAISTARSGSTIDSLPTVGSSPAPKSFATSYTSGTISANDTGPTNSSSPSPSSTNTPISSAKSGLNQGEIIGTAIGSVAAFLTLMTLLWAFYTYWEKEKRRQAGIAEIVR
jgi:hypothetical protein